MQCRLKELNSASYTLTHNNTHAVMLTITLLATLGWFGSLTAGKRLHLLLLLLANELLIHGQQS